MFKYKTLKLLVLIMFKLKKPKREYQYLEECHGVHISEYQDVTKILGIKFIETYHYGTFDYQIK